jgi:hypothetical protein
VLLLASSRGYGQFKFHSMRRHAFRLSHWHFPSEETVRVYKSCFEQTSPAIDSAWNVVTSPAPISMYLRVRSEVGYPGFSCAVWMA